MKGLMALKKIVEPILKMIEIMAASKLGCFDNFNYELFEQRFMVY